MKDNHKSQVKAAGMKAGLKLGDKERIVTAFDKGNTAAIIPGNNLDLETNDYFYWQKTGETSYQITPKKLKSKDDSNIGVWHDKFQDTDYAHLKVPLEKRIFSDCPNDAKGFQDNIHIQIAYHIIDVLKIFAVHANDLVCTFNNLRRLDEDKDTKDFVGCFYGIEPEKYDCKNFKKYANMVRDYYHAYFDLNKGIQESTKTDNDESRHSHNISKKGESKPLGSVGTMWPNGPEQAPNTVAKNEPKQNIKDQDLLIILSVLSNTRQSVSHGEDEEVKGKPRINYILNPDKFDEAIKERMKILCTGRIDQLNDSFIENNAKNNLPILFDVYNVNEDEDARKTITCEFYDYVVKKTDKNLGFSIKQIREILMPKYFPALVEYKYETKSEQKKKEDPGYLTCRQKVYLLLDFMIYKVYKDDKDDKNRQEELVNKLRGTVKKNDNEKQAIYTKAADFCNEQLNGKIEQLQAKLNNIRTNQVDSCVTETMKKWLAPYLVNADSIHIFAQYVYFLTRFLDGKEINDLITTLISKFENIASFMCVACKSGIAVNFNDTYKLFEQSEKIAQNLRLINSFSRMNMQNKSAKIPPGSPDAIKGVEYVDAARLLDFDDSKRAKDKDDKDETDEAYVTRELKLDQKVDHSARNFIANNVINSRRFQYVVRHVNPKTAKDMMIKPVVKFVLNKLDENLPGSNDKGKNCQGVIDKYCERIYKGENKPAKNKQIDELCNTLTGIKFEDFLSVKQEVDKDPSAKKEKERLKGLISLYLLVMYTIVKNLVYVNARYVMAIYRREQDAELHEVFDKNEPCSLTQKAIDEHWGNSKKKRHWDNMRNNIVQLPDTVFKFYRNAICHLNVVQYAPSLLKNNSGIKFSSWFSLYHFLCQAYLWVHRRQQRIDELLNKETPTSEEKIKQDIWNMFKKTAEEKRYGKNLLKILNTPFGYNHGRYNALSVEKLFDRNQKESNADKNESAQS
ncbi:MAG: type VI-D CRISPR-associated RNA-guided ribonuclease Cas13d [Victivallales bacterium]|jgi:hypothetical protein|nr:type VI-D CRISPR-associated RNA-guided ribonuclease Cas13d [Victivallales bacterium]